MVGGHKRYATALTATNAGVLYLYGKSNKQSLRFVEPTTGELLDALTLPAEMFGENDNDTTFYMGSGYDLYVKNKLALWGLTLTLAEDDTISCTSEKVIDWVNSDLSATELDAFCIADNRTMTAVWHDTFHEEPNKLLLLIYVETEDVVIKEEIQLAMLETDYTITRAVANYNRQSSTHRIVVTDYTVYEDDIRRTKFDTEMAAGNVPDIVFLPNADNMVEDYSRAGLFANLTPWIQKNYGDELLGNITKPYQNRDGAQFVLPTQPSDATYFGKADYFDDIPTTEEILAIIQEPPAGTYLLGSERSDFWYLAHGLFMDTIDWENGTCSFDSDGFIDTCKQLIIMESAEQRTETSLCWRRNGSVYAYITWLMQGEYTVPVRLPNADGKLYLTDSSYSYLAIIANSTYKEECYAFPSTYMEANHKMTESLFTKQDVYASIEQYEDKTIFMTPAGFQTVPNEWLNDPEKMVGITGERFRITKADADAYVAFLDRFEGRLDQNSGLYDIYHEELMDNDRTAKEVATAIQSRAGIYLAENH